MKKSLPNFEQEFIVAKNGFVCIAGVDEVGRACLAGPIVAGAVVFDIGDANKLIRGLRRNKVKDSKLMTPPERERAATYIQSKALRYAIGSASNEEIDKFGIGAANILAFKRALDDLNSCDFALIDGRHFKGFDYHYRCIIKGDNKSLSIAAASIIAKVYRDDLMRNLDEKYPHYHFASNKGYGGKKHYAALQEHGPTPLHRKSFLRWMNQNNKLF